MARFFGILLVLALTLPSIGLVTVATLLSPAAVACTISGLNVGEIPDSLTARTRDGHTVTLNRQQLTHAATIITVGSETVGVGRPGVLIALMAALTESTLRMLANPGAYPESVTFPNDGDGSDHDSLGLFQMRPIAGWGSVAELMDASYQARAFYGGPTGPNSGSPRGLLDIEGWQSADPGVAAQSVEVSAYPDRYQNYQTVAEAILDALTTRPSNASNGDPRVPETTRIVFPLPPGTYTDTSSYGWRTDPFTGERRFHEGSDFAAAGGTPILAIADGIVTFAGPRGGFGNLIIIEHTVNGEPVASFYAHMWDAGVHVVAGSTVAAGQHIGDVGSSGRSTGTHLHLEVHPGGPSSPPVNAIDWLTEHGAQGLGVGSFVPAGCIATAA
ncbi:Peptidase family M23 [Microbacterium sp. cf046]|uniref:M23 family metallopeptidase n=1 Tax=Microbacterium sp. cf046 TaxID=1761803 RepID=UPI0008EEF96D|nr:M23 family metallopeptidase [Microbacterium sp. cf046]SFS16538.1 Peptidase family M23 [Microbacterium sp. cf046]